MKLLILGSHTCGNRGDTAILRGLLDVIHTLRPQSEVDVMSRYPVSSSWLLPSGDGRPAVFADETAQRRGGRCGAREEGSTPPLSASGAVVARHRLRQPAQHRHRPGVYRFCPPAVELRCHYPGGGSFFVDLCGVPQFEHALCAFMAKKLLFMVGYSVGPFQDEQFNPLANNVFGHCNALILRESVSLEGKVADVLGQLPELNVRVENVVQREREKGVRMVESVLARIGEVK